MENLIFGIGFSFSFIFRMLAAFSCKSFALCGRRGDVFGKVDLFCEKICIGVTLDGLVEGIGVFVGETV